MLLLCSLLGRKLSGARIPGLALLRWPVQPLDEFVLIPSIPLVSAPVDILHLVAIEAPPRCERFSPLYTPCIKKEKKNGISRGKAIKISYEIREFSKPEQSGMNEEGRYFSAGTRNRSRLR